MKSSIIFRPFIRLFQRKKSESKSLPLSGRRSWNEVFSYKIGPPEDEATQLGFKLLKELRDKGDEKKDNIDTNKQ